MISFMILLRHWISANIIFACRLLFYMASPVVSLTCAVGNLGALLLVCGIRTAAKGSVFCHFRKLKNSLYFVYVNSLTLIASYCFQSLSV